MFNDSEIKLLSRAEANSTAVEEFKKEAPVGAFSKEIGQFFRERRLTSGVGLELIVTNLALSSEKLLLDFEDGRDELPLFQIYALSNLLGLCSTEVMERIYKSAVEHDLVTIRTK